jgi:hypothetical protein
MAGPYPVPISATADPGGPVVNERVSEAATTPKSLVMIQFEPRASETEM